MNIDLTTLLAIYGALLATIVFLWDVIKFFHDRPNLRVEADYHIRVSNLGASEPVVGITMINTGKEPLTIVASGFRLDVESDENMATVVDTSLPRELTQGQSHTSCANFDEVVKQKVLYAWARDATGRVYRSKKRPLRS